MSHGLLSFKNVDWRVRIKPWYLPEEIAFAIGRFFRQAGADPGGDLGASDGDFAPWNLLSDGAGTWSLLDWEEVSDRRPPFWDVLHFLVQGHALLGRPSERDLLDGLDGRGWVSRALEAYAAGAEVPIEQAIPSIIDYLQITRKEMDPSRPDGRRGIAARERLLVDIRSAYVSQRDPRTTSS